MPSRLYVPYSALNPSAQTEVILDTPARCSHCGSVPAPFFETHAVKLRAKRIPHRSIGQRYRIEKRMLVRLPLCEACYLNDFLSTPDSYAFDTTPQGKEARRTTTLAGIAGVTASLGIIMLTPFIPAVGILAAVKPYWYVLLIAGVTLLIVTWLLQQRSQKAVRAELARIRPVGSQFRRADVWSIAVDGDLTPTDEIVEIHMPNEDWANECANLNGWRIEQSR